MKRLTLFFIRFYQKTAWFSLGVCRFTPSCSDYTYRAVKKYGSWKGLYMGIRRILRCHPFSRGGHDPVK